MEVSFWLAFFFDFLFLIDVTKSQDLVKIARCEGFEHSVVAGVVIGSSSSVSGMLCSATCWLRSLPCFSASHLTADSIRRASSTL